jgi:uncharacterized iron-regulated membrane protein
MIAPGYDYLSSSIKYYRKFWLKIHLYLGLTLGAIFAVIGLTGSLIVFWQPIDAALNPVLFDEAVNCTEAAYCPLDELIVTVNSHAPDNGKLHSLFYPNPERGLFTANFHVPTPGADWDDRYSVFVDPCSGVVTGSRFLDSQLHRSGSPLIKIISRIHTSLLLNFPGFWLGNHVLSFGSALLMVSIVIGAYLWWPRNGKWVNALSFKRNSSAVRFNYDLHKIFGITTGLLLIVSLFTGLQMYKPWSGWIERLVNRVSPVSRLAFAPVISELKFNQQIISAEQAVNIAKNSVPDGQPVAISFPKDAKGVYSISLKTVDVWDSKVIIDQYSGEVLRLYTPSNATAGDHFLGWLFPLHTGHAFGLPGRILILVLGLVPTVLYVTGFIRWRQKRRAAKQHQNKCRSH